MIVNAYLDVTRSSGRKSRKTMLRLICIILLRIQIENISGVMIVWLIALVLLTKGIVRRKRCWLTEVVLAKIGTISKKCVCG